MENRKVIGLVSVSRCRIVRYICQLQDMDIIQTKAFLPVSVPETGESFSPTLTRNTYLSVNYQIPDCHSTNSF